MLLLKGCQCLFISLWIKDKACTVVIKLLIPWSLTASQISLPFSPSCSHPGFWQAQPCPRVFAHAVPSAWKVPLPTPPPFHFFQVSAQIGSPQQVFPSLMILHKPTLSSCQFLASFLHNISTIYCITHSLFVTICLCSLQCKAHENRNF